MHRSLNFFLNCVINCCFITFHIRQILPIMMGRVTKVHSAISPLSWEDLGQHLTYFCGSYLGDEKKNSNDMCLYECFVLQSAVVYQLQRRVRNLRDQLQRRDLHLDLLRKKLTLQEDSTRTKSLIQAERDEANLR